MREAQQQRLSIESTEERESRLQQMREAQQQRLQSETPEETEMRHSRNRLNHAQSEECTLPLFCQGHVHSKMKKFHSRLAALQMARCATCLETFPGRRTSLSNDEAVCVRCLRDEPVPKMYSAENNMNPGTVPPELTVSVTHLWCIISLYFACYTSHSPSLLCIITYPQVATPDVFAVLCSLVKPYFNSSSRV